MHKTGLVPKSDFLNLANTTHLAAGGQTPLLASHMQAFERFAEAKGTGLKGQARNTELRHSAARRAAARLGCTAEDIGFPSSVAHAMALLAESIDWQAGDNVVVEAWEFPSLLNPWLVQRDRGVELRVLQPDGWRASLDRVRDAVDERTRVLALSHVSYLTGERHDLKAYGEIAREAGALFVVDASHAFGAVPVHAPVADFVFSCCYKWILGIQGVAVACWNRERVPDWRPRMTGWHSVTPRPPLDRANGPDPLADGRVFEPGNPNYAGLFVLDNALEYLSRLSPEQIEAHDLALSGKLRDGLAELGLELMTPAAAPERAGNVCFASPRAPEIRQALEDHGVLVSGEEGRVRLSTHLYNDEADVSRALSVLTDVLAELRH